MGIWYAVDSSHVVPQPCSVHQCPVQLISLCTFPGRSSSSWLTSSTAGPPRIPSSPGCAMSLAKWMGFGSAQSASNGHASTPNTATESAKTGTISKADYKQFGLENVSVIMFFLHLKLLLIMLSSHTLSSVRQHLVRALAKTFENLL